MQIMQNYTKFHPSDKSFNECPAESSVYVDNQTQEFLCTLQIVVLFLVNDMHC